MNNNCDPVIVAYGRSPMCRANKGGLAHVHPVEYGAHTLKGVLARVPQLDPAQTDDVLVGCAMPERFVGYNVARQVVCRAGLPDCVPAQTVNRFCSSGLQTIATAAAMIQAGQAEVVVAGGLEQMTGLKMDHPREYWDMELDRMDPGAYMSMGMTAENVAERWHISRADMDMMAVESHHKAAAARAAGKFREEIIPFHGKDQQGAEVDLDQDDGIRENCSLESVAKLEPCFKKDGIVTAATSSQMTDGTAFVVLMSRRKAKSLNCVPIASMRSFAVAGVAADVMGIGPMKAVPMAMERAGLQVSDMDCIEINEAFASQSLACIRELGFPVEKTNPNGGALALGHPLGATGAILTCKLLSQLRRIDGRYGLVTMCIGGGMGAAGIFEMESR